MLKMFKRGLSLGLAVMFVFTAMGGLTLKAAASTETAYIVGTESFTLPNSNITSNWALSAADAGLGEEWSLNAHNSWASYAFANGIKVSNNQLQMSNRYGDASFIAYYAQLNFKKLANTGVVGTSFDVKSEVTYNQGVNGEAGFVLYATRKWGEGNYTRFPVFGIINGKAYAMRGSQIDISQKAELSNVTAAQLAAMTSYRVDVDFGSKMVYIYAEGEQVGTVGMEEMLIENGINMMEFVTVKSGVTYPEGDGSYNLGTNITTLDNVVVMQQFGKGAGKLTGFDMGTDDENSFTVKLSEPVGDVSVAKETVTVKSVETGAAEKVTGVEVINGDTFKIAYETEDANIGGEYAVILPAALTGMYGSTAAGAVLCERPSKTKTIYAQDFNKTVEYANYVDGQLATTDWYQTAQVLNDASGTLTVSGKDGSGDTGTQYFDYLYGGGPVIADNAFEIKNVGTIRTDAASWIQKNITIDFTTDSAFTEQTVIEFDAAYSFTYETAEGEAVDHTKGWFMLFDNSNGQYIFTIEGNKVRCGADWSDAAYSENDVIEQGVPAHYKIVIDGVSNQNNNANIKDVYVNGNAVFENALHSPWAGTGGLNFRLFIDPSLKGKRVEQKLVIDNFKVTQPGKTVPYIKNVRYSDGTNAVSGLSELSADTNSVAVQFSEAVTGYADIALKDKDGNTVSGAPNFDSATNICTVPVNSVSLLEGSEYTLVIPQTVANGAGNTLSRAYNGKVTVKDERVLSIEGISITKGGNGVTLGDIAENDVLNAAVSYKNTLDAPQSYVLLLAVYNDGKLSDVDVKNVTALANTPNGTTEAAEITVESVDSLSVKAFLFNSLTNIKPVCNAVTVPAE